MPTQDIKTVHDILGQEYDLGSLEDFQQRIQAPENQKITYDLMNQQYEMPEFADFQKSMAITPSTEGGSGIVEGVTKVPDVRGQAVQGFINVLNYTAGAVDFTASIVGAGDYTDQWMKAIEGIKPPSAWYKTADRSDVPITELPDASLLDYIDPQRVGKVILEQGPTTAALMLPYIGQAGRVARVGKIMQTAIAAAEAGDTKRAIESEEVRTGIKIPVAQKYAESMVVGIINSYLEKFGIETVISGQVTKAAIKGIVKGKAASITEKASLTILDQAGKHKVARTIAKLGATTSVETMTEVMQQFNQDMAVASVSGNIDWDREVDRLKETAYASAWLGLGGSAVARTTAYYAKKDAANTGVESDRFLQEITNIVEADKAAKDDIRKVFDEGHQAEVDDLPVGEGEGTPKQRVLSSRPEQLDNAANLLRQFADYYGGGYGINKQRLANLDPAQILTDLTWWEEWDRKGVNKANIVDYHATRLAGLFVADSYGMDSYKSTLDVVRSRKEVLDYGYLLFGRMLERYANAFKGKLGPLGVNFYFSTGTNFGDATIVENTAETSDLYESINIRINPDAFKGFRYADLAAVIRHEFEHALDFVRNPSANTSVSAGIYERADKEAVDPLDYITKSQQYYNEEYSPGYKTQRRHFLSGEFFELTYVHRKLMQSLAAEGIVGKGILRYPELKAAQDARSSKYHASSEELNQRLQQSEKTYNQEGAPIEARIRAFADVYQGWAIGSIDMDQDALVEGWERFKGQAYEGLTSVDPRYIRLNEVDAFIINLRNAVNYGTARNLADIDVLVGKQLVDSKGNVLWEGTPEEEFDISKYPKDTEVRVVLSKAGSVNPGVIGNTPYEYGTVVAAKRKDLSPLPDREKSRNFLRVVTNLSMGWHDNPAFLLDNGEMRKRSDKGMASHGGVVDLALDKKSTSYDETQKNLYKFMRDTDTIRVSDVGKTQAYIELLNGQRPTDAQIKELSKLLDSGRILNVDIMHETSHQIQMGYTIYAPSELRHLNAGTSPDMPKQRSLPTPLEHPNKKVHDQVVGANDSAADFIEEKSQKDINPLYINIGSPDFLLRTYTDVIGKSKYSPLAYSRMLIQGELLYKHNARQSQAFFRHIFTGMTDKQREGLTGAIDVIRSGDTQLNAALQKDDPIVYDRAQKVITYFDYMRAKAKDYLRSVSKILLRRERRGMADAFERALKGEMINSLAQEYTNNEKGKESFAKRLADLVKSYEDINNWGLDNFITNMEKGTFRVFVPAEVQKLTRKGEPKATQFRLAFMAQTREEARLKAKEYLEEHPDTQEFYLDTRPPIDQYLKTHKSQSLKKMRAYINQEMVGKIGDLSKMLKGMGRPIRVKGLPKIYAAPMMKRDNVLEGHKDITKILPAYAYAMEKKIALDPVITEYNLDRDQMPANVQTLLDQLVKSVEGVYGWSDRVLDHFSKDPEARHYRATKLVAKARNVSANLKLGYRPIAGLMNLMKGQTNTWIKTGFTPIQKAYRERNTPNAQRLLHEERAFLGLEVSLEMDELKYDLKQKHWFSLMDPLAIFKGPELLNREIAYLAGYYDAQGKGMDEGASREYARNMVAMTQFLYSNAAVSRILRSNGGKLFGQFKTYLIKEFEFMRQLKGEEIFRYTLGFLSLAGVKGMVYVAHSLPIIGMIGYLDDFEEWLDQNAITAKAARGVFGLIGGDVTAPATVAAPHSWEELAGPVVGDLIKLFKQVVIPTMQQEGYTQYDAINWAVGTMPVMYYWSQIVDSYLNKDGWVRDERGNRTFQMNDVWDRVLMTSGINPIDKAKIDTIQRIIRREEELRNAKATRLIQSVVDRIDRDRTKVRVFNISPNIPQTEINAMIELGVTPEAIEQALITRGLTPGQAALIKSRLPVKLKTYQRFGRIGAFPQ